MTNDQFEALMKLALDSVTFTAYHTTSGSDIVTRLKAKFNGGKTVVYHPSTYSVINDIYGYLNFKHGESLIKTTGSKIPQADRIMMKSRLEKLYNFSNQLNKAINNMEKCGKASLTAKLHTIRINSAHHKRKLKMLEKSMDEEDFTEDEVLEVWKLSQVKRVTQT